MENTRRNIVFYDTAITTSNIGDEIIMDAINRNMKEIFESGFSLRMGTHVNNFSPLQIRKKGKKVRFFEEADWKFVLGTNLIAQKRLFKRTHQWVLPLYGLSVYENCILVGAGTVDNSEKLDPLAKYVYGKVLSKKYVHSVRDELTKRLVESVGCKAINTGCPTLWELTPEHCAKIPHGKADACILTVSGYNNQKGPEQDQKLINILRRNYKKLYAWIQTTVDEGYLKTFEGTDDIERIYSLEKYKEILEAGNVDYVGTRLHGGVYALQHGCRTLVISIDHRAEGFHETNNLPIVRRDEIDEKLEGLINSEFATEIVIDQDAIDRFKAQFEPGEPVYSVPPRKTTKQKVKKALKKGKKTLKKGKKILKKGKKTLKKGKRFAKTEISGMKQFYGNALKGRKKGKSDR